MLQMALEYWADEWSIFPVCTPVVGRAGHCFQHGRCKHPGKTPLIKWGTYQDRLAERSEVEGWWTRWPEANIGLATGELSGVVVVDLDGEVARAEANRRGYEPGPWVRTGRVGGQHLYFRYREDAPTIFAKTGGIDFRGQGGYALLPPSTHHSGTAYEWVEPVRRGEPLPVLPRWIDELALTTQDGTPREKIDFGRLVTDGVPEGQRDQELFRAAAKLRGADVPYEMAVWLIQKAAQECSPPFDQDEARAKVDSAYGRYLPNATITVSTDDEISAADLVRINLPEPRWAIPGVWPEGVVLLVGKSKLGKSWLAMDGALAIAEGGIAWGAIEVEQGDVLYLALEDSKRRLQDRLKTLRGGEAPAGLTLRTKAPRANEGGIELVLDWLDRHPKARLIIIDVLGKFRPKEANARRLYDLDYEAITPIGDVARARGVCVLVIHHANKLNPEDPVDSVSGTTGLVGAADAICIFRRERGKADASLYVVGRDVEEQDLAFKGTLKDKTGNAWEMVGDAAQFRLSEHRQEILGVLRAVPGMNPNEIASALGKSSGAVRQRLFQMVRDGQVRCRENKYFADDAYQTPHNSHNAITPPVTPVTDVMAVSPVTSVSARDRVHCRVCKKPLAYSEIRAGVDVHLACSIGGAA